MSALYPIHKMNSNQLKTKILFSKLILRQIDSSSDTFVKGIIERHIAHDCENPIPCGLKRCFCKFLIIFDPKKQKDATVSKFFVNKTIFVKFMIKSWYEAYLFSNKTDYEIRICYCELLFHRMRYISPVI